MSVIRKLLGVDEGWGIALGTLLVLSFGLFVLFVSVADLREAARVEPVERTCRDWLLDPSGPRWVRLTGCKLDLAAAASRQWKGWLQASDGGVQGKRFLELFVPLRAEGAVGTALLATQDQALLSLLDAIEASTPEEARTLVEAKEGQLREALEPAVLEGYVEPMKSLASRSALTVLSEDETSVVLEHHRTPPRANALFGLAVGLLCVGWAVRMMARRFLIERELEV